MKIWLNNKRLIKTSKYPNCKDCILSDTSSRYTECLSSVYKICLGGYKYEIDVQ